MLFQVEEQAGFLLRFVYFETLASNLKSFGLENQVCKLPRSVFPNLFLVRGTLAKLCRYLAAPLDGQIGKKIKELN